MGEKQNGVQVIVRQCFNEALQSSISIEAG